MDWTDWISANVMKSGCSWLSFNWSDCFIFICWYIWKWRNKSIFDDQFRYPESPLQIISEWFNTMMKVTNVADKETLFLRWIKPPLGYFKLNVDGSRDGNGVIGAGGVIRDSSGNWIQGFAHHIGSGEVIQA